MVGSIIPFHSPITLQRSARSYPDIDLVEYILPKPHFQNGVLIL